MNTKALAVLVSVLGWRWSCPHEVAQKRGGTNVMQKLEGYDDLALLVGRLFYSSLFWLYGYFKLTGYAGTVAYMTKQGLPVPALFAVLAIIFELGGGILMLVGYQTRVVALALAVYVVVAALIAHTHWADGNQMSHFFKNMAIVGGSLAFFVTGAGAYSLDRRKA
jgi:putative oxidoreductase